jgi:hypothetical protein
MEVDDEDSCTEDARDPLEVDKSEDSQHSTEANEGKC